MTITASFSAVAIVLLTLGYGILGSGTATPASGIPAFLLCGMVAMLLQWLLFLPAWRYKTEMFYDLAGSVSFLVIIGLAVLLTPQITSRDLLLAILVAIWAVRLGSFLFNRIVHAGKDSRFDAIRCDSSKFFLAWTMQGCWVYVTAGAALASITVGQPHPLEAFALAGFILWMIGFMVEVIADNQKQVFKSDPANQGQFIDSGLWAYSRHPNYFGEILVWCGIALIAFPTLHGWQLITLASPLFVAGLLCFISGIPMLEQQADERWGNDPAYQAYKNRTPVLFPFRPRPNK